MGFTGKSLIHIDHIVISNEVFTPTQDEVKQAKSILETIKSGIGTVNGMMVDEAMTRKAQRVLSSQSQQTKAEQIPIEETRHVSSKKESSTGSLAQFKTVGEKRYRETSGLYWDDFVVGDVFEHRPGRTVLDVDNVWFTLLSMNVQQVHFDQEYANKTEWKKLLVDSTFTLALLTGMSVRTVSAKVVANLGWDNVKITKPVFAGDTIYAESTVLGKRESKSRPTQGIVTVRTRGVNQRGETVMTFDRTMLVYKRGHSPESAANYKNNIILDSINIFYL